MKEMIIVIGNMASGKSTTSQLLAEKLSDYRYVCQDDFRNSKADRYLEIDNRIFEDEIAEETINALNSHRKIIYESTGGTRFFKDQFYRFLQEDRKLFIVRIKCRPSTCLSRFEHRKSGGKNHLIPIFAKSKSPKEIIDHFEKKAAWIKPHLEVDSEKNTPEEIVELILKSLPGEDPLVQLEKLIHEFDYNKALEWVIKNVKGKTFLKEVLSKGPDQYNVIKLKLLLNDHWELHLVSKPKPKPKIQTAPKKQTVEREEIEELIEEEVEERVGELQDEIEELRKQIAESSGKNIKLEEEDDLDEKWKPVYKEANHFFSMLEFEQDTKKRKEIAFHILDLMDQVQEVWEAKDFKKKHGQLPNFESQGIEQLTIEQMATRIRTLRTYITKANKGQLKKERIPEWEAEMKDLERRIKG
jgi:shikimate kinase